jgi:hypothetical protein
MCTNVYQTLMYYRRIHLQISRNTLVMTPLSTTVQRDRIRARRRLPVIHATAPLLAIALLLIAIPAYTTASADTSDRKGVIYFVFGSDSSTPGIHIRTKTSHYRNTNFDLWRDPNRQTARSMDSVFRNRYVDSNGEPFRFTWWMQTGSLYRYATNTNLPYPSLMSLYLMNKYQMDNVLAHGDEYTYHYHTWVWSDASGDGVYWWNQTPNYVDSRDDFILNLAEALIEEDMFPVSFRSGWHFMDNDWQADLDDWIPFSLHNAWPVNRPLGSPEPVNNLYVWNEAPSDWVPFQPRSDNYQLPGGNRGWNTRSIHFGSVRDHHIREMFEAANQGIDQVPCIWSHVAENRFIQDFEAVFERIERIGAEFPDVEYRYDTAVEAMQRWLGSVDRTPPVLTVDRIPDVEGYRVRVRSNEPLFQPRPFLAAKDIYERHRRVEMTQTGELEWLSDEIFTPQNAARWSIAVTDTVGNQTKYHARELPDDIYLDDESDGFSAEGNWQTLRYTELDPVWGSQARVIRIAPAETAGKLPGNADTGDQIDTRFAATSGDRTTTNLRTGPISGLEDARRTTATSGDRTTTNLSTGIVSSLEDVHRRTSTSGDRTTTNLRTGPISGLEDARRTTATSATNFLLGLHSIDHSEIHAGVCSGDHNEADHDHLAGMLSPHIAEIPALAASDEDFAGVSASWQTVIREQAHYDVFIRFPNNVPVGLPGERGVTRVPYEVLVDGVSVRRDTLRGARMNAWEYLHDVVLSEGQTIMVRIAPPADYPEGGILVADAVKISAYRPPVRILELKGPVHLGEAVRGETVHFHVEVSNRGYESAAVTGVVSSGGLLQVDTSGELAIPAYGTARIPVSMVVERFGTTRDTLLLRTNDPGAGVDGQFAIPVAVDGKTPFSLTDNEDAGLYSETGTWRNSVAQAVGTSSRFASINPQNAGASARFTLYPRASGWQAVSFIVPSASNSALRAVYMVKVNDETVLERTMNQNADRNQWVYLGRIQAGVADRVDVIVSLPDTDQPGRVLRADAVQVEAMGAELDHVLADNETAEAYTEVGVWSNSVARDSWGTSSRFASTADAQATWTLSGNQPGLNKLSIYLPRTENAAIAARYTIWQHGITIANIVVDQNPGSGAWRPIGTFLTGSDAPIDVTVSYADPTVRTGVLRADAVRLSFSPDGVETSTGHDTVLPERFELAQNFPNPFNPVTTINFTLSPGHSEGTVRLVVYDLLGREVARLADGRFLPGTHSVRFDGRSLASGVYIYRLETAYGVLSRKMMLMK